MWMIGLLILLTLTSYWAGFRAPGHLFQFQSKAGFVVFLGLTVLLSYHQWREVEAFSRLESLVGPLPEATDSDYVPEGEVLETRWILYSELPVDSLLALSRNGAAGAGWTLTHDTPPWLTFARDNEQMTVFVSEDEFRPTSTILYSYTEGDGGG